MIIFYKMIYIICLNFLFVKKKFITVLDLVIKETKLSKNVKSKKIFLKIINNE